MFRFCVLFFCAVHGQGVSVAPQIKPFSPEGKHYRASQAKAPIRTFVGRYVNSNYGYSFLVPDALKGLSDSPPAPQHGVLIPLSDDSKASIWVGGSYNSEEYSNASEALEDDRKRLSESGSIVASSHKKEMRLGGLPAKRSIVRYKSQVSGENLIQDLVVCIRKEESKDSILYEIYLSTPETRYNRDRHILDLVLNSWKTESLP